MKIEKAKEYFTGGKNRAVHYDIPKHRIRLSIYYMNTHREIRFLFLEAKNKQTKRKKKGGPAEQGHLDGWVIEPRITAPNHAILALAEAYLTLIMRRYRKPAGKTPRHKQAYAELMWRTILDRFLGASINTKWLHLDYNSMLYLKREMEHHGYIESATDD